VFGIIGLLVVVTAYSALNLENRSDVSLGLYTFRGVPVFLTSLIALILGAVLAVPLTLRRAGRRHASTPGEDGEPAPEPIPDEPEPVLLDVSPEPELPAGEPEPDEARPPGGAVGRSGRGSRTRMTLTRATAIPAVAANPRASSAKPTATRVRFWLRHPLTVCLIALAAVWLVPDAYAAQPPGDAAAELAASGRLDAALTLLDGWLAEHPGDARLFPVVLQVVTAAPQQGTVDAILKRYGNSLAADSVGVLRAVPADLAELRGGVEDALAELRRSRLPNADRRQVVLMLELGQIGDATAPREAPIAVHAGLARAGQGQDDAALERSLRAAFAGAGQAGGGADGAVAGYGLVALLNQSGRTSEAMKVLAELGRRYPRSPEYVLAAAELRAPVIGGAVPAVVAMPSPAMLLGSAVLECPAPCTIPKAVLSEPPAPAATPAPKPQESPPVPPQRQRQSAADAVATRVPPSGDAPRTRPAEPVVLVPARTPDADAGAVPPDDEPDAAPAPAPAPALAAAVEDDLSVALRSTTPAPAPAARPTRDSGTVTVRVTARAANSAARQAAERLPLIEEPARRSGDTTGTAARGSSAAAPRTSSAVTGTRVRVTAQPANRPVLSADRVFVPATPRADNGLRQPEPASGAASVGTAGGTAARASSGAGTASAAAGTPAVRVASTPDPAAFVVQVGAYISPDNALDMELKLRQAGFSAIARSYRDADGSIVHRVGVGGNVTRAKAEQLLGRLRDAGFDAYLSRRDVRSYLPPQRRRR
jgi:cell division septation protein DedD